MNNLEDAIKEIKFDEKGLVPAIAQEASTGEVLMLAYMNEEALRLTLENGTATYFSRSRNEIWVKGKTSGNTQAVREVLYDCDSDTILVIVDQTGGACHTGERNCFFKTFDTGDAVRLPSPWVLTDLAKTLKARKTAKEDKSYTASLYKKGKSKIIEKIKEECDELVEALEEKDEKEVICELTDLWFHTMVALENENIDIREVFAEFQKRFGMSGIDEKNSRQK